MPTEEHEGHPFHRRYNDGKINWSAVGVILAFSLNLVALVWLASARNTDIQVIQSGLSELKSSVQTLSTQSVTGSIRMGILESKVDDLRDQRGVK